MPVIGTPIESVAPGVIGGGGSDPPVQLPAMGSPCCEGTPAAPVLLSAVVCTGQNVIGPDTTTRYRKSLYKRQRSVTVRGGQAATLRWQMLGWDSNPLDLSECVCPASESSESSQGSCDFTLRFRLREQLMGRCSVELPVTVEDVTAGQVLIDLPQDVTKRAGIYYGEVAAFNTEEDADAGENVVFSNIFTVVITGGQWASTRTPGPPSFAEIRLHLRDSDPSENLLLDGLTFDDAEIAFAIKRPVEYWNEIPPPVRTYTTQNFPFKYHWLMGITGELFLIAAEGYRKNHLAYSAAGISIDDQAKEPNYEKAAQMRLQDYRDFVRRKKVEMNVAGAFGEVVSDYGLGR